MKTKTRKEFLKEKHNQGENISGEKISKFQPKNSQVRQDFDQEKGKQG